MCWARNESWRAAALQRLPWVYRQVDHQPPIVSWRSHANLLYSNWLNYFVYQTTPYNLAEL